MADGKTHFIWNLATAGIVGGLSIPLALNGIDLPSILAFNLGTIAGILVTPDVDQETAVYPYHVIGTIFTFWMWGRKTRQAFRNTIVRFMESLWSFYSIPVSHRHMLTHVPIISTAIRMLYMYFFWGFLFFDHNMVNLFWQLMELFELHLPLILLILGGMSLQDFTHAFLDGFRFHW